MISNRRPKLPPSRFVRRHVSSVFFVRVLFAALWLNGDALRAADRFGLIETVNEGIASM